ncbi:helix-turn-helix domain-containing protein [Micromonospora sp. C28ISP2-4]|uniref:winged helix-turn-helix transcriptional regulator n=1 Tax=Micromonospora sp. C28ISP2-4 TaxID=3059523 RepID=UPI0026764031|nr:winged helix-turn-helix transcriptional regulator [Micromonospora sp. C28ISP2-4]MDO3685740.1 winged helix-turn-helix transcriptional regulator [Micromonospora sp. C28ISP2-4]
MTAVAAKRLKRLVADGLLQRRPHQEPGEKDQYEYPLTELGRDLFPCSSPDVMGERLGRDGAGTVHAGCGSPLSALVKCANATNSRKGSCHLQPRISRSCSKPGAAEGPKR